MRTNKTDAFLILTGRFLAELYDEEINAYLIECGFDSTLLREEIIRYYALIAEKSIRDTREDL